MAAATVPHHNHEMEWIDKRARDVGLVLGIVGVTALAFAVGRATAPGSDCCEDLLRSQVNEIRLQGLVGLFGMDEAWEMGAAGQPNPVTGPVSVQAAVATESAWSGLDY